MATNRDPSLLPGDAFDWEQKRSTPPNQEHISFIELLEKNGIVGTELELFLNINEGSPRQKYQFDVIQAVCPPEVFCQMRKGTLKAPGALEKSTWVDERDAKGRCRKTNGSRSCASLRRILATKRFQAPPDDDEDHVPDSERRLIYLPNPNAWSLATVILAASWTQATFLPEFIRKHLTADRSIAVRISEADRGIFSLQFHLPFFVWKRHSTLREDPRKKPDGSPLRKSTDLSFLRRSGSTASPDGLDCLYEAQASCIVTGYNNDVWTAYSLVDTFFYDPTDDSDFCRDSIEWHESELETGISWDPLTASNIDADKPVRKPREYFLLPLKGRMEQIKEEWHNIIYRLRREVEDYIKSPDIPMPRNYDNELGSAEEHSKAVLSAYRWTKEVSSLLTRLIHTLSNLIKAGDQFESGHLEQFYESRPNYHVPQRSVLSLREVKNSFEEFHNILADLEHLNDQYDNFRQQLELYFMVENNRAIVLQQWNVTFSQTQMHFVSPPALAAGVLQSDMVPFQPVWASFVFLTIIFGVMTQAIRPMLTLYWNKCRHRRQIGQHDQPNPLIADCGLRDVSGLTFPEPTFARHRRFRGSALL